MSARRGLSPAPAVAPEGSFGPIEHPALPAAACGNDCTIDQVNNQRLDQVPLSDFDAPQGAKQGQD